MEITRYGLYEGGHINPKPDGTYVKFTDVVVLLESYIQQHYDNIDPFIRNNNNNLLKRILNDIARDMDNK